MNETKEVLEDLKKQLSLLIELNGFGDSEVLNVSIELEKLIDNYYKKMEE